MDLDAWIEKVKTATHLEENELKKLCEYVRKSCLSTFAFLPLQFHRVSGEGDPC